MEEDRIVDLTVKELSGELTGAERKELQDLISASETNALIYSDLKTKWDAAGRMKAAVNPATEKSWQRFQNRNVKTIRPSAVIARIAALLVVALGVGYYFLGPQSVRETSFITSSEKKEVNLPDGSMVTLNINSRLTYQAEFTGKVREVSLEGEAFFNIFKNPDRPFVIFTNEATVEVLGTSFNVEAYEVSDRISVSVSSGRVALRKNNAPDEVILEKGMFGFLDRTTGTLSSNAEIPGNPDYWRTNFLRYNDLPLREVIEDLSKQFDTQFEFDDAKIGGCRFTSSFENPTLDEVLEILTLTMNLNVEKTADGYRLSGEGCNQF